MSLLDKNGVPVLAPYTQAELDREVQALLAGLAQLPPGTALTVATPVRLDVLTYLLRNYVALDVVAYIAAHGLEAATRRYPVTVLRSLLANSRIQAAVDAVGAIYVRPPHPPVPEAPGE